MRTSPWLRLLEAALRARVAKREPDGVGTGAVRNLSGCLLRLLLVGVVLFLALVAAVFLFGRTLMYSNAPY